MTTAKRTLWLRLFCVFVILGLISTEAKEPTEKIPSDVLAEKRDARILIRAMLASAEVTLFSIDPESGAAGKKANRRYITPSEYGGDWLITGEATITDRKMILELVRSLQAGFEEIPEFGSPPCFEPRHAVRFKRKGDEITLLICFDCTQLYAIGFKERPHLQVSAAPLATWNRIFTEAGLTIAPE